MQHKTFSFALKASDDQQGFIKAYAAIFNNVDQGNDRILPGAFKQSIKDSQALVDAGKANFLATMLWNHDVDAVIGGWFNLAEDSHGLVAHGEINLETQLGRETYSNIKMGTVRQFSIGYDPVGYSYTKDGVRELSKLKLWEISPVTFAMNEEALLVEVKKQRMNTKPRTFNDYYREARARKASYPDSTWTAITDHMDELLAELERDEPDLSKIRKAVAALGKRLHEAPQNTVEDLSRILNSEAYTGYDAQGTPKSRFARARREIDWEFIKLATLLDDNSLWEKEEKKLSPVDRGIAVCRRKSLRNEILGIPEPKVLTGAELQAKHYARSGAVFHPKLGRWVEV